MTEFIQDTSWENLPYEVKHKVKWCLLDALGATIAGTLTPASKIVASYASEVWPGTESTILLHGRSGAIGAAFANGYTANALDIDDGAKYTRGHAGAQLFPTALAMGEKLGSSGKEILTSMVVGYEIAHRVGRCWHDHHEVYQACGSWGSVASAVVVAKLMDFDKEEIEHALGIAEYNAPNLPMMRAIESPSMVKHGTGWGAMTGIISAQLATKGFTGVPNILGFDKYKRWMKDIGRRYIMTEEGGIEFKQYASCSWGHPTFKAALDLFEKHDIKIAEVEKIWVKGFHEMASLQVKHPESEEEAQFSIAWPLAALLIDGEVGPDQMTELAFEDEEIRSLAGKIEVVQSKEIDQLTCNLTKKEGETKAWAGSVEIVTKDGKRYDSGPTLVELGPQGFWTKEKLEDKFRWLVSHRLDEQLVEKLIKLIEKFEQVSSVRELTNLLDGTEIKILTSGSKRPFPFLRKCERHDTREER